MIEIKHNTLKLRNPDTQAFEVIPGLALGVKEETVISVVQQLIFETTYPVGKILHTTRSDNPSTYLGGGTWVQIKDTFLLSAGEVYKSGDTGGESEHTLVEEELPFIDGAFAVPVVNEHSTNGVAGHAYGYNDGQEMYTATSSRKGITGTATTSGAQYAYGYKFGADQPHNNMPPYKVVYVWERVS